MGKDLNIPDIGKFHSHIMKHVPGAIIVFDVKDGMLHMCYVSENCINISGFTPDELYARSKKDIFADVHPEDRKLFEENAWDPTQENLVFTYRVICKDGRYKWVRLELSRVEENGKVMYFGLSNDVDEQHKLAELKKEVDRDKEKEKILLSSIPGGVALYHVMNNGTVCCSYISEGLAGILGYTAGEFLEHYANDTMACIMVEDRPILTEAFKNLMATHTPISTCYRCYTKNGKTVTIRFDGNVLQTGTPMQGEIASLYAVQTQIGDEYENAMQEEEIRRRLIDYLPGGIGIYDLYDGVATLRYLNNAYLTMMDLTKEDRERNYGHDILPLLHPEDRHVMSEMIEEIHQGSRFTNVQFRIKTGGGTWKWINLVMRVMPEENGHFTGYASLYDFDTVIRARQQMEAAHEKEETLLSSIPGGVAVYHIKKNGKVATEYVSEPLAKMCGYTAEEYLDLLREDALINLVPEDIPAVNAAIASGLDGSKVIGVVYRIYKKDKTPLLFRVDANLIAAEQPAEDELAVFYAVHTLVSEESRRIMEEQKTYSDLLNSVPAGIGVFQAQNNELSQEYMNDAFYEILHSTRARRDLYSGKKVMEAIHPDDLPRVLEVLDALMRGAPAAQVDSRLLNGLGGYTWFHITASVTERKKEHIRFFAAFIDCTDSKEQELLLLQNQRATELAQSQGDLAIWTYNIDKGIIYQQADSIEGGHMGYPVCVENVPEVFVETGSVLAEDIEIFRKAYRDLADGKEKVDVTYRLRDQRTGNPHWLRMFYQRMEDSNENDRMAVGFSMNVDKQQEAVERYQVEKALREQMNDNVLMYIEYNLTKDCFETEGKLVDTYRKRTWEGTSAADYKKNLAQSVESAYVEEVGEKLYAKNLLKAFNAGESKVYVEYRSKAHAGMSATWYRTDVSLVKRPDTGDVMAFVYIENIEKEKERKLALESSLSDGIESIAVICIADRQTRLLRDNFGNSERILTTDYFTYDDDFVWRSHNAVVEEDRDFSYQAGLLSTVLKELEKQEVYQYSVGSHNKSGVFRRQLFRYRYLDDRKKSVVMSISDITTVYLEEQAKKKQIEQALAQTKKAGAAKADFYSRMSHDMRTPMNGILGMTALSEDEQDAAVLRENMEKIRESGQYLLSLINDTLDIQRIESGKLKLEPQIVHAAKTAGAILEMVRPQAEAKNITLQFDRGNADMNWYVRADPVRFKQIFVNLLSNAIKFTPPGGTVRLSAQIIGREGMISHGVFHISDTGIGMSEKFLENGIFQPFSQENNQVTANYAGSGLGLSIVKSLVEMMSGSIEVESEQGTGTTFTLELDFERVEQAEAERAMTTMRNTSENVVAGLHGKKILLVEDHPLNAEIAEKLLKNVGCEVTWAQNGLLGVETFAASADGFFDTVLMDVRMPVMDGLEAARQIRALPRADAGVVPIIAMTANAYEDDVRQSKDAGMNAHLGKPVDPQKLYSVIASYAAVPCERDAAE